MLDSLLGALSDIVKTFLGAYFGYLLARRQDDRKLDRQDVDDGNAAILSAGHACMDASVAIWTLLSTQGREKHVEAWLDVRRELLNLESQMALALHEDINGGVQVHLDNTRDQVWALLEAVDVGSTNEEKLTDAHRTSLAAAPKQLEGTGRTLFECVAEDSKSTTVAEKVIDSGGVKVHSFSNKKKRR